MLYTSSVSMCTRRLSATDHMHNGQGVGVGVGIGVTAIIIALASLGWGLGAFAYRKKKKRGLVVPVATNAAVHISKYVEEGKTGKVKAIKY